MEGGSLPVMGRCSGDCVEAREEPRCTQIISESVQLPRSDRRAMGTSTSIV